MKLPQSWSSVPVVGLAIIVTCLVWACISIGFHQAVTVLAVAAMVSPVALLLSVLNGKLQEKANLLSLQSLVDDRRYKLMVNIVALDRGLSAMRGVRPPSPRYEGLSAKDVQARWDELYGQMVDGVSYSHGRTPNQYWVSQRKSLEEEREKCIVQLSRLSRADEIIFAIRTGHTQRLDDFEVTRLNKELNSLIAQA